MVKVVNGYLCFSSCEEVTARQGKDPHAPPGASQFDKSNDKRGAGAFDSQPATVLDGALKDALSSDAVTPVDASAETGGTRATSVDILV
jgi:hypothetical protein